MPHTGAADECGPPMLRMANKVATTLTSPSPVHSITIERRHRRQMCKKPAASKRVFMSDDRAAQHSSNFGLPHCGLLCRRRRCEP